MESSKANLILEGWRQASVLHVSGSEGERTSYRTLAGHAFVTDAGSEQRLVWVEPHTEGVPQARPVSHHAFGKVLRAGTDYMVFAASSDPSQYLIQPLDAAQAIDEQLLEWVRGRTDAEMLADRERYAAMNEAGGL